MAKKDQLSDVKELKALNVSAISTDTTTNGNAIDTTGYESVTFVFGVDGFTDGTYTPVILEGADNNISNATAVADTDLLPAGTGQEAAAALSAAGISKIGYRGDSQYVWFTVASTGTTTGATGVHAECILGYPHDAPVS